MGLTHSPKVITDGLVFYYDQNNIKSYRGPAIQNLARRLAFSNTSNTGVSIAGGYETIDVPQIGQANAAFSIIQNNYTSFSPNSVECCPHPIIYSNNYEDGFTVSPSTLYTYAIVYKVNSGYTNANYMYRYEYNGGTYVGEAGVHNASNRIHLGDGWYWAWATFTTAATTNWIGFQAAFYYRYSDKPDKLSIAKVLITPGNYTGLHPKYWPSVNTTRGATQVLADLTGRNTITTTSLSYTSGGTFSFNGTDSNITTALTASSLGITDNITISLFTRRTASPTNALQGQVGFGSGGSISIKNSSNYFADIYSANNTRYVVNMTTSGTMIPYENVWVNLCVTVSGTSINTYLNGVLANSQTMDNNMKGFSSETLGVGNGYGYYRLQGEVDNVNVYNRALTAAEIQQNFNALRGRYGI